MYESWFMLLIIDGCGYKVGVVSTNFSMHLCAHIQHLKIPSSGSGANQDLTKSFQGGGKTKCPFAPT